MDNTGPQLSAYARQIGAVRQQRIYQCAAAVAGTGMHHQAGWFVDNNQLTILVKNLQRNRFRLRLGFRGRWDLDRYLLSSFKFQRRPDNVTIYKNITGFNQSLYGSPGLALQLPADEEVKPY
jgi:hypothetical protein